MKTSILYLVLFLIMITGAVSLGSQNLKAEHNENSVQYELNLSSEDKILKQESLLEIENELFVDKALEFEQWMSDPKKWN